MMGELLVVVRWNIEGLNYLSWRGANPALWVGSLRRLPVCINIQLCSFALVA